MISLIMVFDSLIFVVIMLYQMPLSQFQNVEEHKSFVHTWLSLMQMDAMFMIVPLPKSAP